MFLHCRHVAVTRQLSPSRQSCGQNTACCADLTEFFLSLFLRCRPMLEKTSVVATMRKSLILQDSSLRTWPFARPQGAEKERGKTGQDRQNQASRWVTKSASPSEKPRQARGLTGLIDMQRECLCMFYWWWNTDLNPEPPSQDLRQIDNAEALSAEQTRKMLKPRASTFLRF